MYLQQRALRTRQHLVVTGVGYEELWQQTGVAGAATGVSAEGDTPEVSTRDMDGLANQKLLEARAAEFAPET